MKIAGSTVSRLRKILTVFINKLDSFIIMNMHKNLLKQVQIFEIRNFRMKIFA